MGCKYFVGNSSDYVKQETLSTELVEGIPEKTDLTESYKLGGYNISLGVRRLT